MNHCSRHDTRLAFSVNLTDWMGHDLEIDLEVQSREVITSQRFHNRASPGVDDGEFRIVSKTGSYFCFAKFSALAKSIRGQTLTK